MKVLLLASLLAFSTAAYAPSFAQETTMTKQEIKAQMKAEKKKNKREKNKSSSQVVVSTPAPVAPAPAPVAPAPAPSQPAIDPYTQSQIDKALSRPQSFNCTYCAAFAASQGDLETVAAIGAGTYMQSQEPSPVAPTQENAPVDAAPADTAPVDTPADTAPSDVTTDQASQSPANSENSTVETAPTSE